MIYVCLIGKGPQSTAKSGQREVWNVHGRDHQRPLFHPSIQPHFYTEAKVRFPVKLFHYMTYKVVHNDRNGHITRDIFHCGAMISSLAKVVGLQSWPK